MKSEGARGASFNMKGDSDGYSTGYANGAQKRPGTFDYYMSEPVVKDDAKGVGPFLLAYTEMLRLG